MGYTLKQADFLQHFYFHLAIGKELSGVPGAEVNGIIKKANQDGSYDALAFAPDDHLPGGGATLPLETFVRQYHLIPVEDVLKILGAP